MLINFIKNNKFLLFALLFLILISFSTYQFYFFYNNNKILKSSTLFNQAKNSKTPSEFDEIFFTLSNESNFYAILSSMELINNDLKNNNLNQAYNEYLKLLNNKSLNNIYLSIIAIHGSYNFLDKIKLKNKNEILEKINNLIKYIDDSLLEFKGLKLEILYLLSIKNQDFNKLESLTDESINLYNEIINSENVPINLKERIKKIHEFQKNK